MTTTEIEPRQYTCPMHPEVISDVPGDCPKCGGAGTHGPDLGAGGRRRPRVPRHEATILGLGAAVGGRDGGRAMAGHDLGWFSPRVQPWVEFLLASPVVLWAGGPSPAQSTPCVTAVRNMWTLIGLGVAAAYLYSVVATVAPGIFPASLQEAGRFGPGLLRGSFRDRHPDAPGSGTELRARSATSDAIRGLLGLAPKTARVIAPDGTGVRCRSGPCSGR